MMDAPNPSQSAAEGSETIRKSSRLSVKPRRNARQLCNPVIRYKKADLLSKPGGRSRSVMASKLSKAGEAKKGVKKPAPPHVRQAQTRTVLNSEGEVVKQIVVYLCKVEGCNYFSRSEEFVKSHEKKLHPQKRRCKVCQIYSHDEKARKVHSNSVHQMETTAVKCQSCEFIAPDQKTLDEHRELEHYEGAPRNEHCREMVDGEQCKARFGRVRELRQHLADVHGLAAALDTIREEFSTREEFLRWKANFERETGAVYKIGYGRRHGLHRYMCSRSGRYKPVPDDLRQRRRKQYVTIKIGFNCTSTMVCSFPEAGGISVLVYPFHYGHTLGDLPLPGMKPEGAPADWMRRDTRKRRMFKKTHAIEADGSSAATAGGDVSSQAPSSTLEGPQWEGDQPSSQEGGQEASAAGDEAGDVAGDEAPESYSLEDGEPESAPGDGAASPAPLESEFESKQAARLASKPARLLRRLKEPDSPTLSEPKLPKTPRAAAPRRKDLMWNQIAPKGLVNDGMPTPQHGKGLGRWYKKLLKHTKVVKRLQGKLAQQAAALAVARREHEQAVGAEAAAEASRRLVISIDEEQDVLPVSEHLPLLVLRADPGDVNAVPDGVFPELPVITAPLNVQEATDTIFDLKLEVLSLRARLARRAAVETALRVQMVQRDTAHALSENAMLADLAQTKSDEAARAGELRAALQTVFSRAQIAAIERPDHPVPWVEEDYEKAVELRWFCSQRAYDYVRNGLNVPLPTMNSIRALVSDGSYPAVVQRFLDLVRKRAMEGSTVGEDEDEPEDLHEEVVSSAADSSQSGHAGQLFLVENAGSPKRKASPLKGSPTRRLKFRRVSGEADMTVTVRWDQKAGPDWCQPAGEYGSADGEDGVIYPASFEETGSQEVTLKDDGMRKMKVKRKV
ncbi:uncharacterized protein LOC119093669 [Pollicipes pollicipes]|uniref:uncharacterized protein LOC119093669 n=1 Tax=Pollicipes pollicipes TaxID=41117 RepID=UPI0018851F29|nr:uncharacterized protein LOC119093669 [Pollicipes pollicipes]XP_037072554.1 uncharacterized protein LOC119093669 [Pollicipes pollicipes]XP_037072555.1 uncharacterized protein LOC119093669 [Pollicipes pollicipes]XP_037072557.1 uncharacterized protein LOC119093669 [Pollicipes pollicipes]